MKRIVSMIVLLGLSALLGASQAWAAKMPQVSICHWDNGHGDWRPITVNQNAGCGHLMNHDDGFPGGYTLITGTHLDDACQPITPPPSCGNCFDVWGGTGCEVAECQDIVCATDSFCCENAWDIMCINEAYDECYDVDSPVCTAPSCGDCLVAQDGVSGCSLTLCEAAVCGMDEFCCETTWDETCVQEAEKNCVNAVPPICVAPE